MNNKSYFSFDFDDFSSIFSSDPLINFSASLIVFFKRSQYKLIDLLASSLPGIGKSIPVGSEFVSNIAKIGEKITIRRANFFDNSNGSNFSYVHSAIDKGIGKIISVVKLDGITKGKNDDVGGKIAMHIAASNPLAITKENIDKSIVDKELEIIKAEIINSGKPTEMAEKISKGKITKFLNENSLLEQIWIMDPKKKVSEILNENSLEKPLQILDFIRYKVGEGI